MICHCNVSNVCPQHDTTDPYFATPPRLATFPHPATAMTPPQRRQLALQALAGAETISHLAGQHEVSRKFRAPDLGLRQVVPRPLLQTICGVSRISPPGKNDDTFSLERRMDGLRK